MLINKIVKKIIKLIVNKNIILINKENSFQLWDITNEKSEVIEDIINDYLNVYNPIGIFSDNCILFYQKMALLTLNSDYFVNQKTRNILNKSKREGCYFKRFDFNDELDSIYEINISKKERSAGGKMRGWYNYYPMKREHLFSNYIYYGIYLEKKLIAYAHIVKCGNLFFFRHFIGHGEYLKYGIMNLLIDELYNELSNLGFVNHFFHYGCLSSNNKKELNSNEFFKVQSGFRSEYLICKINKDNFNRNESQKRLNIFEKRIIKKKLNINL